MARTAIPPTSVTPNSSIADPAGTAIDPTNGHLVDCSVQGLSMDRMVLRVVNSAGSTKTATVKATTIAPFVDDNPQDLVVSVPAGETAWVGPLTSARFVQPGTRLYVDPQTGMTGAITAFVVPRS